MFLNTKGRILLDSIIYRTPTENVFLIECDVQSVEMFQRHLKMYRVRRKIDITNLEKEFQVYAMFNPHNISTGKNIHEITRKIEGVIAQEADLTDIVPETSTTCKIFKDLHIYNDPRISNLGVRIIVPIKSDINKQISEVFHVESNPNSEHTYRWLRYNLGVGEGVNDLPLDNSFPLEANCDYLHGISFHKGCYIGQELTARTYHTGVVRKRLMPINFQKNINMPTDVNIIHNSVNLGKLRGVVGNVGLGLLRIEKALAIKDISISNSPVSTLKPFWWPIEAPKERISLQKT